MHISPAQSQKGVIIIQRCPVENQKADIANFYGNIALLVLNRTSVNRNNALLVLSRWYLCSIWFLIQVETTFFSLQIIRRIWFLIRSKPLFSVFKYIIRRYCFAGCHFFSRLNLNTATLILTYNIMLFSIQPSIQTSWSLLKIIWGCSCIDDSNVDNYSAQLFNQGWKII